MRLVFCSIRKNVSDNFNCNVRSLIIYIYHITITKTAEIPNLNCGHDILVHTNLVSDQKGVLSDYLSDIAEDQPKYPLTDNKFLCKNIEKKFIFYFL